MNTKEKNKYKIDFKKALDAFSAKLSKHVSTEDGAWTVKGFIDVYKNIYTISVLTIFGSFLSGYNLYKNRFHG